MATSHCEYSNMTKKHWVFPATRSSLLSANPTAFSRRAGLYAGTFPHRATSPAFSGRAPTRGVAGRACLSIILFPVVPILLTSHSDAARIFGRNIQEQQNREQWHEHIKVFRIQNPNEGWNRLGLNFSTSIAKRPSWQARTQGETRARHAP